MKKLTKIQQELVAPKGQYNSFGNYKYRSCEDIVEAVKPLLDGAILTMSDDIVSVGDRIYVKATVTISEGEESKSVSAFAREPLNKKGMDESQITGTASSYARKYALNGLFAIDDTKDQDSEDYKNETETKAKYQESKNTQNKAPGISTDETCPACSKSCTNIKTGTTKTGKPYEMGNCDCGERFFINRK